MSMFFSANTADNIVYQVTLNMWLLNLFKQLKNTSGAHEKSAKEYE